MSHKQKENYQTTMEQLEIVFSSVNHEIHFPLAQKIHMVLLCHITHYAYALELLQMGLNVVNPGLIVRVW